jgi:starch synthase
MPAYLRTAYRNEPVFQNAKIVYSLYNQEPTNEILQKSFREKSLTNQFESAVAMFETSDGQIDIEQGAIKYSDGLIDNMDYAPLIDSTATNILHKVEAADASNYYNFYNDLVLATV